ncbi:HNH endonuclease [Streptomyces sp. NPDC001876]|uniref:HNH endonuclease n=1 Tax=Streptomyces sp. NPDC001876 TaxID=3154402 RepID=UPI00332B7EE4
MKPTDIDVDDFFEFIGDFNSRWTEDRRGIVLATAKKKPYQAAAYLVELSRPSMVVTFKEVTSDEARSRIYDQIRGSISALEHLLAAKVNLSWRQRTIRVVRQAPITWPSSAAKQGDYARSAAAAKRWYHQAQKETESLISRAPDRAPVLRHESDLLTREMISRPPPLVPTPKARRAKATAPSAWPIPITPATVPNGSSASSTQVPPSPSKDPSLPARAATPQSTAKQPPVREKSLCAICKKPVSAGLTRHQRCESRVITSKVPEPSIAPSTVSAIESTASVEYQRLVRKVEQREPITYGERRENIRQAPVRLEEARNAVLLRCQGRCENPTCGGAPNDLTDDGRPILEVDHVQRITEGGRDHPSQMVALCPNCHAMKERGANRQVLQAALRDVAARTHQRWNV